MMQTGMDVFYAAFSNRITPLKLARNAVFKLAEHSGPVKKARVEICVRALVFATRR